MQSCWPIRSKLCLTANCPCCHDTDQSDPSFAWPSRHNKKWGFCPSSPDFSSWEVGSRNKTTTVKKPDSKKVAKPSYGQNLVHRWPVLSFQFFEKWSILYIHVQSSTFIVSVYASYYTTRLLNVMNLLGKMATDRAPVQQSWSWGEDIKRSNGLYAL